METLTTRTRSGRTRHRSDSRSSGKPSRGRRTSSRERQLIIGLAVVAALGAAFAPGSPTGYAWLNVPLCAAFGGLVTLATSRARRWSWLAISGLAVLGNEGVWLAVAAVALLFALVCSLLGRRRVYGAVVGMLAVQSLLRLPPFDVAFGSALVAGLAVAPVFASAYLASPRRVRRRVHRSLLAMAAIIVVGSALFGVSALLAYSAADQGAELTEAGLRHIQDGKSAKASDDLAKASDNLASANRTLSAWWAAPARAVPLVAQHAEALDQVTRQGAEVTAAAEQLAKQVDYDALKYDDGRIDLERIRDAQAPLDGASRTIGVALREVRAVRSPWLLAPLSSRVDEFEKRLVKAESETAVAAEAAHLAPALLGGDGTRHYFIAFTTPAELRGLGGFMGNWAELRAQDGKLELTRAGRAKDLNDNSGPNVAPLSSDPDYIQRYARFRPDRFMQDVTASPDLPTVSKVIGELYPQLGGSKIDGVLVVDPGGIAALLELSGPIKVDGLREQLTAKNAVEVLTKQQYFSFDTREDRADFLDQAGRNTFEKLVRGDIPSPKRLSDALTPAVDNQHLRFWSLHPEEQSLLRHLSVDGSFHPAEGADFLSLRTQNSGNNKIDIFLDRKVRYDVSFDPTTGSLSAKASIELHNAAPSDGLPDAILGSNDKGLPRGTNALYFSFYSPHGLRQARIDGEMTPMEFQRELGLSVYSRVIQIPPGETVKVELDLFGQLNTGQRYALDVNPQPTVNPDQYVVAADVARPFRFGGSDGSRSTRFIVEKNATEAVASFNPRRPTRLAVGVTER